jgi:hypothetical protein
MKVRDFINPLPEVLVPTNGPMKIVDVEVSFIVWTDSDEDALNIVSDALDTISLHASEINENLVDVEF